MFPRRFLTFSDLRSRRGPLLALVIAPLFATLAFKNTHGGQSVSEKKKRVIGATATVTEVHSGLNFRARVDTGAKSCSLHVESIVIKDKEVKRVRNVGKNVRIQLKASDGKLHWIDGVIAAAVRVKSPSLKGGEYDHRYKVPLTLKCEGFSKEVLVTLNDRADMEFPLLLGRNYLRGDFLVDVEKTQEDSPVESSGEREIEVEIERES
jgi:hypothetical protein